MGSAGMGMVTAQNRRLEETAKERQNGELPHGRDHLHCKMTSIQASAGGILGQWGWMAAHLRICLRVFAFFRVTS